MQSTTLTLMPPSPSSDVIRKTVRTAVLATIQTAPAKHPEVQRNRRLGRIAISELTSLQAMLECGIAISG